MRGAFEVDDRVRCDLHNQKHTMKKQSTWDEMIW